MNKMERHVTEFCIAKYDSWKKYSINFNIGLANMLVCLQQNPIPPNSSWNLTSYSYYTRVILTQISMDYIRDIEDTIAFCMHYV